MVKVATCSTWDAFPRKIRNLCDPHCDLNICETLFDTRIKMVTVEVVFFLNYDYCEFSYFYFILEQRD